MNRRWSYDHRQNLGPVLEAYFRSLIAHHESSLEDIYVRSSKSIPDKILPNHVEDEKYDICKTSILSALLEGVFGFDIVPDIVLHYSQPWFVEDLGSRSIWYIGILAHSDRTFLRILRSCFCNERSVPKISNASPAEDILHSVFGIDAVVTQVLEAPLKERDRFVRTLIEKGSTPMLEPFIDAGLNLDEGESIQNYLSLAAGLGKLDFFNMLVDAGANCTQTIFRFCGMPNELEDPVFKSLLSVLLDRATSDARRTDGFRDAFLGVLWSSRAMDLQPDGPAILLRKGIFDWGQVVGTREMFPSPDYVISAIHQNRPAALKLLLERGIPWDLPIGELHPITIWWHEELLQDYTMLTLAVELGHVACVDTLLKHANEPTNSIVRPDGGNRSALQLAMSAAAAPHPRANVFGRGNLRVRIVAEEVTEFQDTSVLALLQDALTAEHKGTTVTSEGPEIIGTTKSGDNARHNLFARFPLVATIANLLVFSPFVTFCGHASYFLVDFLLDKILFLLHPQPYEDFSWIVDPHHFSESYQRCKRCGKRHQGYYSARDIVWFIWAQIRQMSISEGILVALGYVAMYVVLVAHASLEFGLSLATAVRVHYRPGRFYTVLGAALIWALAGFWGKRT